MLPEVRVYFERAQARRQSLLGLMAAIPPGYWSRSAPGDSWTARNHVEHVATADDFLGELIEAVRSGSEAWLAGTRDPGALIQARTTAMEQHAPRPLPGLVEEIARSRQALAERLTNLERMHLTAPVYVAGRVSHWGEPLPITLSEYLASWAGHDAEHAAAVREAVSTPPDLSAVALTRRLR